jgi:L-asparaginase II
MSYQPVVEVRRGEAVESVHRGAFAVTDASGKLLASWGNPETVSFMRSTAKPLQALPLLESGAAEHFGLTPKQIAIICSSHSGTDEHVQTVTSIQEQVSITEDNLICGVHPPFDSQTAQRLNQMGLASTPNRHNCSGKHTGMLALAHFLGESKTNYIELDHPVQRRVLTALAEMCAIKEGEISVGVNGCSVPTFAIPIRAAATGYAQLIDPSGMGPQREGACRALVSAMTSHPRMVAGQGRLDTVIMEVTQGRLLAKGGAEGYQGIGIPPGELSQDSTGFGIAIKIADGDHCGRARSAVVIELLHALGAIKPEERLVLDDLFPKKLTNYRGLNVGEIRSVFQLEQGV